MGSLLAAQYGDGFDGAFSGYADTARGCRHHVDVGVHPVDVDIQERRRQLIQ